MKSKLICLSVVILALLLSGCLGGLFGGTEDTEAEISAVIAQFGNYIKDKDFSGLASLFVYPVYMNMSFNDENEVEFEDETVMAGTWDGLFSYFTTIHDVDTIIFKPTKQGDEWYVLVLFSINADDLDGFTNADYYLSIGFTFKKDETSWKITHANFIAMG
jgi:ketosteroid isomerase-like protein